MSMPESVRSQQNRHIAQFRVGAHTSDLALGAFSTSFGTSAARERRTGCANAAHMGHDKLGCSQNADGSFTAGLRRGVPAICLPHVMAAYPCRAFRRPRGSGARGTVDDSRPRPRRGPNQGTCGWHRLHYSCTPRVSAPSTTRFVPLIKLAAGLAIKATARPISSGRPILPVGLRARAFA